MTVPHVAGRHKPRYLPGNRKKRAFAALAGARSTILPVSRTTSPSQAGLVRFPGQARRDRESVIYSRDAASSSLWNMPITLPSVSRKSANQPTPGMAVRGVTMSQPAAVTLAT